VTTTGCGDNEIPSHSQLEYENVDESLLNQSDVVTEFTSNATTLKKSECLYLYFIHFAFLDRTWRRQNVHFADDLGLALFTVKIMTEPSDVPPTFDSKLLRTILG
jgi:hypothetical protein